MKMIDKDGAPIVYPQRLTLKVGDRVTCRPYFGADRSSDWMEGVVTYIHPLKRFYSVRFDCGIEESFQWGTSA